MFQKGEYIIYGNTGVCHVEDVCKRSDLPPEERNTLFYRLSPVHSSVTIYIPVESPIFMRPVITREAALALIARIPEIETDGFQAADPKQQAAHYKDSFKTHDCEDLIQLIKTVYLKNRALTDRGRRPAKTDTQYMQQAEALLHTELGIALGMPTEAVSDFIAQSMQQEGQVS